MTTMDEESSELPFREPSLPVVTSNEPNNVILMGIMGSGKSTLGWQLAHRLGFGFIDLDTLIEKSERKSISKIFADKGEKHFRQVEKKVLHSLVGVRSHVIALGGGTVTDDENWSLISTWGTTIWLNPPSELLAARLLENKEAIEKRPLLSDLQDNNKTKPELLKAISERLDALNGQRKFRFEMAKMTIEDCYSTMEVLVDNIANQLAAINAGTAPDQSTRSHNSNLSGAREN